MRRLLFLLALILVSPATAEELGPRSTGEVRVPLADYTAMIERLAREPRRAPAAYAIGRSNVVVDVADREDRFTATVTVTVAIETFEDEWTLVPILPHGAALTRAVVDGGPAQLVDAPDGIAWSTDRAGTVTMELTYGVDARSYAGGYVLSLAVPRAAATTFSATLPDTAGDVAVVPSAELQRSDVAGATRVTAAVPATSSILVSWRAPSGRAFAISRADYSGVLRDMAVVWSGRFEVEIFGDERITLPVIPNSVTINDLRIDGETATVLDEDGNFATLVEGPGKHQVEVAFQVPVVGDTGPPQARLRIPRIPVSRFELVLPGRKEVRVAPGADVVTVEGEDTTTATAFIPMSDSVVFTWTEAVPQNLRGQVRANASIYHAIHAEEGVLHAAGTIVYEITHGETNRLELEIPNDAQVNRIASPSGGVSDWAVALGEEAGRKKVSVFLERPVSGEYVLAIAYERLLGSDAEALASIVVPLLSADSVQRQRGMVALLSGPELTLRPESDDGLSKVGENQLPAFIRNQIAMTVAHTFKYIDPTPTLVVAAAAPERKQGRFNAQVDTLISLGDVTMKGSATVEIDIKSGTIVDLRLSAPQSVNVLAVSGPSLRTHLVREVDGGQAIELEFTREMEGQFRVEVAYEKIMDAGAGESTVPTISVVGAEVEHGRIAVEALTAVEVSTAAVERLSNLDINELPQQLVLKTTNPILLAFRYVNARPPFRLALRITRHNEIDVQVAAIERADYRSLLTRDGLAVTTARLIVRNSRRQFLRLDLPPNSEIWSVFVDDKAEKPAYAGGGTNGDGSAVLVKLINSAKGFPIDLVYATPADPIRHIGTVSSVLPRPDMVVTHSRWDVFLPDGPAYLTPDSTMDLVVGGVPVNPSAAGGVILARAADAYQTEMGQPLRITVPTRGIQFAFEKLYASQSPEPAAFSIRYVSENTNKVAIALSAVGVIMLWIGIVALAGRRLPLSRYGTIAVLAGGLALLVLTTGYLGASPIIAAALALVVAAGLGLWAGAERWRA
ncbi:MAG: hypothetical protein GY791_11240 [Alphaproteobacteria bacterium]|nr:hypothetical protein [Alphaproteobacteria bacterium]